MGLRMMHLTYTNLHNNKFNSNAVNKNVLNLHIGCLFICLSVKGLLKIFSCALKCVLNSHLRMFFRSLFDAIGVDNSNARNKCICWTATNFYGEKMPLIK